MKYVGIDLHEKIISVCIVDKERKVLQRKKFLCVDVTGIKTWFGQLGKFQFVVEATATYEWLVQLLEPLADAWVLANPGKMRVIAESTRKTDKLDAQTLAESLALGMIPKAYRPNVRQREHRPLVRYRTQCQQRISRLKCQIRYLAATYNADHRQLFQAEQLQELQHHQERLSSAALGHGGSSLGGGGQVAALAWGVRVLEEASAVEACDHRRGTTLAGGAGVHAQERNEVSLERSGVART